jgi:hypothetical protein
LKPEEANLLDWYKWLHPGSNPSTMPFDEGALCDVLVDSNSVSFPPDGGRPTLSLCRNCYSSLKNKKLPALALANRKFLGSIPDELKNLTVTEEAMITRCRFKCCIIQLKEENQDLVLQNTQHGIKGHIIIYLNSHPN